MAAVAPGYVQLERFVDHCQDLHSIGVPVGCGRWSYGHKIWRWDARGSTATCVHCGRVNEWSGLTGGGWHCIVRPELEVV